MPHRLSVNLAIFLAACGAAAAAADLVLGNAADAQSRHKSSNRALLEDELALQRGVKGGGVPGAAAAPDDWAGRYSGSFDGGGGEVAISRVGENRYDVTVSVGGPGCGGEIAGSGSASANRLSFSQSMQIEGIGNATCTMHLTRQGSRLQVTGDGDCAYWSGASCNLFGTVSRQGRPAPAPRRAPATAASSWIVGGWVSRGTTCQSDGGIIFSADGSFGTGGDAGRWTLNGNTLTTTLTSRQDNNMNDIPVRNPRPFRSQIIAHTARAYAVRHPDGRIEHMVRCG